MASDQEKSDFLGTGWYFPFYISNQGLDLAEGVTDIGQAILLILGTAPGERVMRPTFGCSIYELVFAPANAVTATLAEGYITDALQRWEPRITDIDVESSYDTTNPSLLRLKISYIVRTSNVEENLVYPFFLEGGGDLPPDYKASGDDQGSY